MTRVAEPPPETAAVADVTASALLAGGLVPYRLTVAKYEEMARHASSGRATRSNSCTECWPAK